MTSKQAFKFNSADSGSGSSRSSLSSSLNSLSWLSQPIQSTQRGVTDLEPFDDVFGQEFKERENARSVTPEDVLSYDWGKDPNKKPPFAYVTLIFMALRESDSEKLSLSEIYDYITENFAYYRNASGGWKNSIRHNLSQEPCFLKLGRDGTERGKGGYWTLNPDFVNLDQIKSRRRRKFKRRRHGLDSEEKGVGYAGRSEESSDSDFSTSEKDKCDKQSISSLSETPSKRPHRSMYRSANEESSDMTFSMHVDDEFNTSNLFKNNDVQDKLNMELEICSPLNNVKDKRHEPDMYDCFGASDKLVNDLLWRSFNTEEIKHENSLLKSFEWSSGCNNSLNRQSFPFCMILDTPSSSFSLGFSFTGAMGSPYTTTNFSQHGDGRQTSKNQNSCNIGSTALSVSHNDIQNQNCDEDSDSDKPIPPDWLV